jgi:hypothetical protein
MSVKEKELLSIPQDDFLDSYETCRILCNTATESHLIYWKLIDVCEEHIRGKKPKDPAKLKAASMFWANNWNYHKARTKVTRIVLGNIELVKNAMQLAIPEFERSGDLEFLNNEDDRGVVSMKLSRVYYESLEKESSFNTWLNNIEYPSTAFGYNCVIFDGEDDWMGQPIHPRNIAFEDQTEPDKIGPFVLFRTLKASYLWTKWVAARNANTRETINEDGDDTDISTTNWSVKGLQSVLWNALSGTIKRSITNSEGFGSWEEVTSAITSNKNPIQYFIRNTNNVKIARIFYKELSKKWTEVYIPYLNDWQSSGKDDEETGDKIIFKKKHGKKHQDRLIIVVKDSSFTEGNHIHELRGLAKYSVEDSMRFNRKKNNIEDKLTFSGSPFFEQRNTQQKDAFKITPSQGFTLVKQGFDLLPVQPNFDLSNHLLSIELDEKHFLRETEHFDARLEGRLTSRPVKDEVQQKSKEVQDVKSSKNSAKFADYSKLNLNILKNLAEVEVPEKDEAGFDGYNYFFEECAYELRDFIPENEDPKSFVKKVIKSVVSFQIEPVLSDVEALQLAISMAETSYARNRLKRMLLMAQGFPRKEIDRIAPLPTDSFRNLRDEWKATVENDIFWTSNEVVLDPEDDGIDHLNIHFSKFQKTVQAIQEGRVDIVNGFKYLANLASHQEEHLKLLSQDPTLRVQYEQLLQVQDEFTKILGKLKSAAESELKRRQEEEQNTIPPEKLKELQLLEFEKVNKQRRTEELTKHKQALTEQNQAHRQALEDQEQAHRQALERQEAEVQNRLSLIKEASKSF